MAPFHLALPVALSVSQWARYLSPLDQARIKGTQPLLFCYCSRDIISDLLQL